MKQCYNCGWQWKQNNEPAFREMCPRCDTFLHSCKNCRLYDTTASNKCKSSTTELVGDKERGNFCEEFRFKMQESAPAAPKQATKKLAPEQGEKLDPREKWRRLFKD